MRFFQKELIGLRGLFEKGYYPKTKILAVERAIVELRGAAGNDLAQIARAKSSRGPAETQIVRVKRRSREEVVKQLKTEGYPRPTGVEQKGFRGKGEARHPVWGKKTRSKKR